MSSKQERSRSPERRNKDRFGDARGSPLSTDARFGVDTQALQLARLFMQSQGNLARQLNERRDVSQLYFSTRATWMPSQILNDDKQQRPFKQVLYALAHGLNALRVVNRGQSIRWYGSEESHISNRWRSRFSFSQSKYDERMHTFRKRVQFQDRGIQKRRFCPEHWRRGKSRYVPIRRSYSERTQNETQASE